MNHEPRGIPLCSVVIPVHNGMPFLESSVKSVIPILDSKIELIVYNNFSTDGTDDFLDSLNHPRVWYFRSAEFLPIEKSWQNAASLARGKWIKILPSDDLLEPSGLGAQLRAAEAIGGLTLVTSRRKIISESGRRILTMPMLSQTRLFSPESTAQLVSRSLGNPFGETSSSLMLSDTLRQVFPIKGGYTMDLDLHYQIATRGFWLRTPDIVSNFRIRRGSVSSVASRNTSGDFDSWLADSRTMSDAKSLVSLINRPLIALRQSLRRFVIWLGSRL